MNDLDPAVIAVLGFVLPPLTAVVNRVRWGASEKALAALMIGIAGGLFAAWYAGESDREAVIGHVLAVYAWMQITYRGIYRPTGLTDAIEEGVLPGPPAG